MLRDVVTHLSALILLLGAASTFASHPTLSFKNLKTELLKSAPFSLKVALLNDGSVDERAEESVSIQLCTAESTLDHCTSVPGKNLKGNMVAFPEDGVATFNLSFDFAIKVRFLVKATGAEPILSAPIQFYKIIPEDPTPLTLQPGRFTTNFKIVDDANNLLTGIRKDFWMEGCSCTGNSNLNSCDSLGMTTALKGTPQEESRGGYISYTLEYTTLFESNECTQIRISELGEKSIPVAKSRRLNFSSSSN